MTRELLRVGPSRESSPGYAWALQQQLQLHADEDGSREDMDIDQPGRPWDGAEGACGVSGQGPTPECARGVQERRERRHECDGVKPFHAPNTKKVTEAGGVVLAQAAAPQEATLTSWWLCSQFWLGRLLSCANLLQAGRT